MLGARADGAAVAAGPTRRSRSPTAGTRRARRCRSTGAHAIATTTSTTTSAAFSHVLATVDEKTYSGGTMGAATTRSPGARTSRAAARSTPASAPPATSPSARRARPSRGRDRSGRRGVADPVYSDCGATVLANYQQTKISAPPNLNEPIGFDVLPDGRVLQTARGGQLRLHDPKDGSTKVIATLAGLHEQRGRPLRAGDRQRLRHQQVGLPLLRAADRRDIKQCDGTTADVTTPPDARRRPSRRPVRRGRTRAAATSSSRASSSSTARTRTLDLAQRAEDHAGLQQPRRVLPRRRRHRLRQAQQPVAGHGRRHAVRRRQLGRLLAAQRPEDRRDADRARQRARAARSR